MMLLAIRPGAEILIPLEHREQMRAAGCSFTDAPAGYAEVTIPTPLAEAQRLAPDEPDPQPTEEPEPQRAKPRRKR